jgi:D-3-phosphoglycerate dehydrogenase
MAGAESGHRAGGRVAIFTDGRPDWYGDDYRLERRVWEPLGLELWSGCGDRESTVIERAKEVDAIVSLGLHVPFTGRVIEHLDRCRVLVRSGAGVENIDVETATARGIAVCHVPDYCSVDVADHTVALILALTRCVVRLDRYVRAGRWQNPVGMTGPVHRLGSRALGLVGFGRVARQVAARMAPMVREVLAYDPYAGAEGAAACGVSLVPLDDLLSEVDIVSLHTPLTAETRHLIARAELACMKPGAVLVNTSRGGVVDEAALIEALREGRLTGAALDVLAEEPPAADSPLLKLDNVILTPHFAGYSEEALETLRTHVAQAVADAMQGRWPAGVLNPGVRARFGFSGRDQIARDHGKQK